MAWYDDAWDFASKFGSAAMDFAKENPAVAGAAAGLGLNAAFGKGENNLQAMGLGAAAGQGASYFANMPTVGGWGGADGAAPVAGMPAASPTSSAATVGTGVMPTAGTGTTATTLAPAAVTGNTGVTGDTGGTMMNKATAGLGKIRDWAGQNEDVLRLGGKGIAAYLGSQAKQEAVAPVRAYNEQYRSQADAATAANAANVGKKNALVDQQVSDYLAIDPQRAGKQAYAGTLSRISEQAQKAAEAETGKGYTASTVAANKRRGMVGATTGATTAAEVARSGAEGTRRAGLSGIQYKEQAVPTYDTGYAAGVQTANEAGNTTGGAYSLYEDVLGLSKKKAETQVGA